MHVQVGVHFVGQRGARRLLQEGTSQLTHRHSGVELRSIKSNGGGGAVPTQHAGRVQETLPGGGRGPGSESSRLGTRILHKVSTDFFDFSQDAETVSMSLLSN